ncbi:hypothetical protein [Planctomicrobium sp. SH527]|uniref:hypothetical protein n=1 Tax=Planctomicrobium sp. SH527 TaxID=3448123 RepID=UPI003F5AECD2
MNCSEFQLELDRAIETRTALGSDARSHGCACTHAACQVAWEDYVLLNQVMPEFRSTTPQVDLTNLVLAKLQEQASFATKSREASQTLFTSLQSVSGSGRSGSRGLAIGAVGAACIVGGLGLLLGFNALISPPEFPSCTPIEPVAKMHTGEAVQPEAIWAPELVTAYYVEWVEGASNRVGASLGSVASGTHESPTEAPVSGDSLWLDVFRKHLKPLEEELGKAVETLTGKSDDDLS